MKIALIFPAYTHKKFSENLSFVDEEFGVYPPLSLVYIAAILEEQGHNIMLIDSNVLRLSKKETLKRIKKFKPEIMAFMLTTYMFNQTLNWIKYLKKNNDIPVICGGINLLYYPRETLTHKEIDFGIIGSARKSLPKLVNAIKNKKEYTHIKGICYREGNKIKINPPTSFKDDLNDLPFPARHLLPNDKYYQFISKRKNFTIMVTAKGCPYSCTFCPEGRIPYFQRSVESTLKEVEECYKKYGIRVIDFFTDTFTLNRRWVINFCRGLKNHKLKIDWSCRSRIDTVDEKLLSEMADAGCKRIYYGIESYDKNILKKLNKEINPQRVREIIKITKKYGIDAFGFFMVGNPGETKQSLKNTINFAKSLNLDFIQVMRIVPKPGTSLNEEFNRKTGKNYWKEFVLGNEIEKQIPNVWCNLSEKEINHYLKKFYRDIYLNPKHIIKVISKINSFKNLKMYLVSGIKMLFG